MSMIECNEENNPEDTFITLTKDDINELLAHPDKWWIHIGDYVHVRYKED